MKWAYISLYAHYVVMKNIFAFSGSCCADPSAFVNPPGSRRLRMQSVSVHFQIQVAHHQGVGVGRVEYGGSLYYWRIIISEFSFVYFVTFTVI